MGIITKSPDLPLLGGPPEITVDAIEFNGTSSYINYTNNFFYDVDLVYEPVGTHTKSFTLSFWVKPHITAALSYQNILTVYDSVGRQTTIRVLTDSNSDIRLQFVHSTASSNRDSSNIIWRIPLGDITVNQWNHIMYSVKVVMGGNTATFTEHLYANDVDKSSGLFTVSSFDANAVQTADTNFGLESYSGAGDWYDGCLSEFWLKDVYYDLSVESNRRRFISENGKPVRLPTSPLIYLNGSSLTWTNSGSTNLGTQTLNSITDCADSPSD